MKKTRKSTPLEVAVKVCLVRKGMSLRELAKQMDTSHQYLSHKMKVQAPTVETIQKISEALGVDVESLKRQMVSEVRHAEIYQRELACKALITDPAKSIIELD